VYSDQGWEDKTGHVECHANEDYAAMSATGIVDKFLGKVDRHASELERSKTRMRDTVDIATAKVKPMIGVVGGFTSKILLCHILMH